jgi:hypothetical protein
MAMIMTRLALIAFLCACTGWGCRKAAPAASEAGAAQADSAAVAVNAGSQGTSDEQAPTRGPGPMPGNAAPAVIQDSGNPDAVLGQLTLELKRYVVRTRSAPKNFEEFVAASRVQAPPPPPGKKYVIDHGTVTLRKS